MSMENGISNKDEIIDNQATGVTEKSAELLTIKYKIAAPKTPPNT